MLPANTSQTPQAPVKQQFHFPGKKKSFLVCCFIGLNASFISFPDVLNEKGVTHETHRFEGTTMSSDSDRTVSVSGSGSVSTDSERTPVRVDSQDSQVSDSEIPGDLSRWPRQNSVCVAFH